MLPFRCCSVLRFSCLFSASALVARGAGPTRSELKIAQRTVAGKSATDLLMSAWRWSKPSLTGWSTSFRFFAGLRGPFSFLCCDTRGDKKKFRNPHHSRLTAESMDDVATQRWARTKQVPLLAALRAGA